MASYNKVMLMGNLTRDPEIRYTPKGTAVTEIGLAVNRVYSTETGEKREEVTFVDITFWGRQAEIIQQYCKKGRPLFVEGRLQLDTWDDKQTGQKRSRLRVVGEAMQLLGSREGGGEGGGGGGNYGGSRSTDYSGGGGSYSAPRSIPPRASNPPSYPDSMPSGGDPGYDDEDQVPF